MKVATAQTSRKSANRINRLRVLGTRANCRRTTAAIRRSRLCTLLTMRLCRSASAGNIRCTGRKKNVEGQGKAEARPAGSEEEEAQRLAGHKGGEEKAHEPRVVEVRDVAQAEAATQVEIDCRSH